MRENILLVFFLLLTPLFFAQAQTTSIKKQKFDVELVTDSLPLAIEETSGLLYHKKKLLSFNDSGGKPQLYEYCIESNHITNIITLSGAKNIDWEAITEDREHFYIADVGNNMGRRDEFQIYKTSKNLDRNSLDCETITFCYPDFKKKKGTGIVRSSHDCEAIYYYKEAIYILTKNWQKETSTLYKVPAIKGRYTAIKLKEYPVEGLVTDACLSPDKTTIAILGYKEYIPFLIMAKIDEQGIIRWDTHNRMDQFMGMGHQTEGIVYLNEDSIYISSEKNKYRNNSLFLLKFK